MKSKWKGLMILILIPVMFLVSCAPSSVVKVTEPGGKVIADNQQVSSPKDQQNKQQKDNKDNKQNTKDSDKKDTKDNKKNITAKADSKPEEKQEKNNMKVNNIKKNINNAKNIKNDNNSNVSKGEAEDKNNSKDVALAITEDNNSTDKQNNIIVDNSANNQQKDINEAVNNSDNNQKDNENTEVNNSKNNEDNNTAAASTNVENDKNNDKGGTTAGNPDNSKNDDGTASSSKQENNETPPNSNAATPEEKPATPETPSEPTTPEEKSPDNTSKWVAAGTQVADVNGEQKELPKGAKTVAAASQYASIVGMIAGGDSIVATSSDNAQSGSLFSVVFKKGTSMPSYMPSAGYAMSESQLNSILGLQGDKKPQVVLYDSATFSSLPNGVSRLNQAGIQTVAMEEAIANVDRGSGIPANDSPYQALMCNVQVVGKMMDSGITIDGKHPESIANDFNDYYDSVKSTLSKYHYAYDNADNTLSSYGSRRWTYYVDSFGINTNDQGEIISTGDYHNYLLQGKSIADILKSNSKESKTFTDALSNWQNLYGSSMKNRYTTTLRYGQENNFFTSALQMVNIENQYTNKMLNSNGVNKFEVSTNRVDNLIVKSPYTASEEQVKLLSSWNATVLELPAGEMTLNVQPEGINSWTSGSPENVLEPLWLATVFHKDSGVDVKEKIKSFYSKFYHYNLNNQQINEILKIS